jgi:hypothetical protein
MHMVFGIDEWDFIICAWGFASVFIRENRELFKGNLI